jgi:hypothetical protein
LTTPIVKTNVKAGEPKSKKRRDAIDQHPLGVKSRHVEQQHKAAAHMQFLVTVEQRQYAGQCWLTAARPSTGWTAIALSTAAAYHRFPSTKIDIRYELGDR